MNPYLKALRAPFLSGSLMPVALGGAWAWASGAFNLTPFLLALLGVACLHTGANLINDWADAVGSDRINLRVTPFSGGSRAIQDGGLSRRSVLVLSIVFYAAALAVGLYMMTTHPLVGLLGALGLSIGFFYSTRPVALMSRGLGEIGIFFAFGPLVTLGAFYVITGRMSGPAFLLGLPLGFLITAVIWINQFPDFAADRAAGKRNLVVRLGLEKARWVYPGLMIGAFVSLLLLAALGMPAWLLIGFGALPSAVRAIKIFNRSYADPQAVIPAQALTIRTQLIMGVLTSLGLVMAAVTG
jgi:1,4-dihydroxy-2-naphthoate octaprenyltransferase